MIEEPAGDELAVVDSERVHDCGEMLAEVAPFARNSRTHRSSGEALEGTPSMLEKSADNELIVVRGQGTHELW